MSKTYSDAKNILNIIRSINENKNTNKRLLTEEGGEQMPEKAIAITDDPKFGEKVLTKQKEHFRSAVDNGVEFSKPNDDNPEESPLIYMPNTGNIIFSGTIPSLGNLKWQFVLMTAIRLWAWQAAPRMPKAGSRSGLMYFRNIAPRE